MKVIIAGSRDLTDYSLVLSAIERCGFKNQITEVVSGTARGVDRMGERWAAEHGVPVKRFYPDYGRYASSVAPKMRNVEMARYADALIAVWDGKSPGTQHMMQVAHLMNLKVFVDEVTDR